MSRHRHSESYGYPESNSSGSHQMTSYNTYDYSNQRHHSSAGRTNGKRPTSAIQYDSDRNDSDNSLSDLETNDFDINDEIAQYMVDLKVRHKKLVDRINKAEKKKQKTLHRELQSRYSELARFGYSNCFRQSKSKIRDIDSESNYQRNGTHSSVVKSLVGPSDPHYSHSSHLTSVTGKPPMTEPNFTSHRVNAYASNSQMYSIQSLLSEPKTVEPELTFDQAWQKTHETISEKQEKFQQVYVEKRKLAYKVALLCARQVKSLQKRRQQINKLAYSRANQATREMLAYWKANEREERELRKKAERDALIKAKQEEEKREKMQQARKLNFLLTQTELFSHFVSKKIQPESEQVGDSTPGEPQQESIATTPLDQNPILATEELDTKDMDKEKANALDLQEIDFDGDNDEILKQKALQGAQHAIQTQLEQTRQFDEGSKQRRAEAQAERELDGEANDDEFMNPSSLRTDLNIEQPKILMCQLKNYQLKGLNWLANLYELGINGILADEMGLGKTVQAISLLSYLAETHNLWGPFIVITPASTLHNWSDELQKFVPSFKVLPYWGSVKDRAILRQDWSKKKLYSKDAPFHILVTSYQMILTDEKYLSRIKWQYMVLDEAQAIKSSSSSRWKTLRKFNCRNRLLLTGTPIQNNMQELWALLNFIMPSLFDSHDEFSEWFSKDIENHAENKGALNEHQVKRLHMILKPFMLRRVKRSVQNELPEKIELEIMCDLTNRQQKLYSGLKENMSLSSLLEKSKSLTDKDNVDSLMNLVMQLRKVCNHPELFKRAEIESSFAFAKYQAGNHIYDNYISYVTKNPIELRLPSFFDDEPQSVESAAHTLRHKLLYQTLNIWSKDFIYKSQYENDDTLPSLAFASQDSKLISNGDVEGLYKSYNRHEHIKDLISYKLWDKDNTSSNCLDDAIEIFTPEDLIRHSTLSSIRGTEEFEKNIAIPGVKQCYLHPVIAPPITVISNNVQSNKSHQENLFHPLYQQLVTANTSLVNQYIRNSDRLPSSFQDVEAFSSVHVPNPEKLVLECGKLKKLDEMLPKLKAEGHRILMYFQMTKMIDIVEEYLSYRKYSFLRLDGSSKISDRRDMVNDWQTCPELFIFLLSTRAGGLGINLTAADTVIFYDSDWNPTVDQQAMDRAHRLGQTRQVTVYRMVTRNSIEERILERARQKDEIHRVVISGGEYKPLDFKPKEIVSLLLDDQAPEATQSPAVAESGEQKHNTNGSLSTPSESAGSKRSAGIDDLLSPVNDIKKPKVEEIFP